VITNDRVYRPPARPCGVCGVRTTDCAPRVKRTRRDVGVVAVAVASWRQQYWHKGEMFGK